MERAGGYRQGEDEDAGNEDGALGTAKRSKENFDREGRRMEGEKKWGNQEDKGEGEKGETRDSSREEKEIWPTETYQGRK